jgi:hypothetical protein
MFGAGLVASPPLVPGDHGEVQVELLADAPPELAEPGTTFELLNGTNPIGVGVVIRLVDVA